MIKIAAFDPSSINLGFACGNSTKDGLMITDVETFKMDPLRKKIGVYGGDDAALPDNLARMQMMTDVIKFCLRRARPDVVVLEMPVLRRNPSSLITQSRALGLLETEVTKLMRSYNPSAELTIYAPTAIKTGVGVDKKEFKDKTAINRALYSLIDRKELFYSDKRLLPDNLDDHSNDSVAMVACKHLEIRSMYG